MEGYEVGDSIHGYRIRAEARKVSDPAGYRKDRQAQGTTLDSDRERRSHH